MKTCPLSLLLMLASLVACGKTPGGALQPASAPHAGNQPRSRDAGQAALSKEEVAAILGSPVTSVDGTAADMSYKTAVIGLETSIDIELSDDGGGAINGARKATGMLGGTPENIPNLGDEAFFGAMSLLYVRAGDMLITITPPNLQLVAATAAYGKVVQAKDSDDQSKAMQELMRVEQTDPLKAGLKSGDDMQGALATVAAASKKQGTRYETQARSIALALAAKVLSKL